MQKENKKKIKRIGKMEYFHTRESNPALPRPICVNMRGGNVTDTPVWI
jgi:hypothetical protein